MPDLIEIKKSQIKFCKNFPIYYLSKEGESVLYKTAEKELNAVTLDRNLHSSLFIRKEDEESIIELLMSIMNTKLAKAISEKGLSAIKQSLCQIVEEALNRPLETSLKALPETIDILFNNAEKNPELLKALTSINNNSPKVIEHSVNVLALTTQYCFFKKYSESEIKKFGLCALLHDIGTSHINKKIVESDVKLSDIEFAQLKTHTTKGYKDIKSKSFFDDSVALTALEHHELLDGSGYPKGIKEISFEAQVIGLIDSYEPLKYRDKIFRKALKPYEALQIIKNDVRQEKYNQKVFVDLCSCLIN